MCSARANEAALLRREHDRLHHEPAASPFRGEILIPGGFALAISLVSLGVLFRESPAHPKRLGRPLEDLRRALG